MPSQPIWDRGWHHELENWLQRHPEGLQRLAWMRVEERIRGLCKSPALLFDVLARGRYRFVYDRIPAVAQGMSLRKRVNLVRAGMNLVWRRLHPWSMPLHMQFEFTSFCNLRCPACPTGAQELQRPSLSMDPALFEQVYEETGPYLLTASLWAWGEPLLHPRLDQMLRIAGRHPVLTLLSTNGMPLRHEHIREILVDHPPAILIVALDGLTDETNSRYRTGARLEPILEGVQELVALKRRRGAIRPAVYMRYIVMRHNEHETGQVQHFAKRHGFEGLSLRAFSLYDISKRTLASELIPWDGQFRPSGRGKSEREVRTGFVCQMPFWFPTLLADGTVVACEQDHSATHSFGRIVPGAIFRDLWYSKRAAEIRRLIRDEHERVRFCADCPYAKFRTSDCSLEFRSFPPQEAPRPAARMLS